MNKEYFIRTFLMFALNVVVELHISIDIIVI